MPMLSIMPAKSGQPSQYFLIRPAGSCGTELQSMLGECFGKLYGARPEGTACPSPGGPAGRAYVSLGAPVGGPLRRPCLSPTPVARRRGDGGGLATLPPAGPGRRRYPIRGPYEQFAGNERPRSERWIEDKRTSCRRSAVGIIRHGPWRSTRSGGIGRTEGLLAAGLSEAQHVSVACDGRAGVAESAHRGILMPGARGNLCRHFLGRGPDWDHFWGCRVRTVIEPTSSLSSSSHSRTGTFSPAGHFGPAPERPKKNLNLSENYIVKSHVSMIVTLGAPSRLHRRGARPGRALDPAAGPATET